MTNGASLTSMRVKANVVVASGELPTVWIVDLDRHLVGVLCLVVENGPSLEIEGSAVDLEKTLHPRPQAKGHSPPKTSSVTVMSANLIRLVVEVLSASDVTVFSSDTADGASFTLASNGSRRTPHRPLQH